ncbi:MAG: sodium-dependent transporter [Oscillospiraceae bacterium]|nr:sodium-dependent transporter [Oscillospiraceae bacterium]
MLENNKRGFWASNFGFIMSAVGSAVGLGNIWGFPFKMGKSGGFTFLLIYILISATVGITMMVSELAIGRKTGKNPIGAYRAYSKKSSFLGWMAVIAPFLILSFYTVLGAYCVEYMVINLSNIITSTAAMSGADTFGAMLTNPLAALFFSLLFVALCYIINRGGVSGGIEKFNKVGMPALFVMLVIIVIRSITLPNAVEGLKYMFVPGYAVEAGFIEKAPNLVTVIATAGGQVFFSLSLAMGIMITYGSYLKKNESLVKNSIIISVCDTVVALLAGLAVLPAAISTGLSQGVAPSAIQLGGPKLLFITLQDVFNSMGVIGPIFGAIFYLLVVIAAITSTISLLEVVSAYFIDRNIERGRDPKRNKAILWVCIAVAAEAAIVAVDGLGSNGIWVPFQKTFGIIGSFNDCWLDFIDTIAEGFLMPLGALIMSILVAWVLKPKTILEEVNGNKKGFFSTFFSFCIRFVVPVVMLLVFLGQMDSFFGLGIFH